MTKMATRGIRVPLNDRDFARHAAALFETLHIRQQIVNLVRIELERRHCRMAGLDAFGESLAETFDWVAQMQGSEWWRDLERALSHSIDRVAPRAISLRERLAALLGRRHGQRRTYHEKRKTNLVNMNLHWRLFASECDISN